LALLKQFGDPSGGGYKIVVGNTEVGIGKPRVRYFMVVLVDGKRCGVMYDDVCLISSSFDVKKPSSRTQFTHV